MKRRKNRDALLDIGYPYGWFLLGCWAELLLRSIPDAALSGCRLWTLVKSEYRRGHTKKQIDITHTGKGISVRFQMRVLWILKQVGNWHAMGS
jgi:hypothetical protein